MKEDNIIKFLELSYKLKEIERRGWTIKWIEKPESVASHVFWVVFIIAFLFKDLELEFDLEKTLILAIIHDLGEAITGDITPYDGIEKSEKYKMEEEAMREIATLIGDDRLHTLWMEYCEHKTIESKLVKEADIIDLMVQANIYKKSNNIDIAEFMSHADKYTFTSVGRRLTDTIEAYFSRSW